MENATLIPWLLPLCSSSLNVLRHLILLSATATLLALLDPLSPYALAPLLAIPLLLASATPIGPPMLWQLASRPLAIPPGFPNEASRLRTMNLQLLVMPPVLHPALVVPALAHLHGVVIS